MSEGIFGSLFDFDDDGEMSAVESAAEFGFIQDILSDDEKEEKLSTDIDELEAEGLDYDELSMMDDFEREEVLEDAGLDPDDYDF